MIKREYIVYKGKPIYLEYNDSKYEIEDATNVGYILIKSKKDNSTIEIFDASLTESIIESEEFYRSYENEKYSNFAVKTYDKNTDTYYLNHYIDEKDVDGLWKDRDYVIPKKYGFNERIGNHTYLIETKGGISLFNLTKTSRPFKEIYLNQEDRNKIKEALGKDTIMVTEELKSSKKAIDRITYGIDVNTFEATTPIYSELEQRFINVYSEEEMTKLEKKAGIMNPYGRGELTRRTINYEIMRYLDIIAYYFDKDESMYKYGAPNDEFLLKFKMAKKEK